MIKKLPYNDVEMHDVTFFECDLSFFALILH